MNFEKKRVIGEVCYSKKTAPNIWSKLTGRGGALSTTSEDKCIQY